MTAPVKPAGATRWRIIVCALVACLAGDFARYRVDLGAVHSDIGQVWFAARALLHGQDPYALIGPGRAFEWPAPWFYPLPAALVALPLTPFSERTAVFVFAAIGAGVLTWALTAHGWGGLWALASMNVLHALYIAQWSPLLAGATVLAPLSVILVAKPTVGAAVFAARPSWWGFGGGIVLLAIAFLVQPGWVPAWRHALHAASIGAGSRFPYTAPITQPGGVLVLVALSRWRRPEARLLVALACVPQTTLPYEGVLLFLIPRGWWQMLTLTALGWCVTAYVTSGVTVITLLNAVSSYAPVMTLLLYLPCVVMVMARPNEGTLPAWLERRIAGWHPWLRGAPHVAA